MVFARRDGGGPGSFLGWSRLTLLGPNARSGLPRRPFGRSGADAATSSGREHGPESSTARRGSGCSRLRGLLTPPGPGERRGVKRGPPRVAAGCQLPSRDQGEGRCAQAPRHRLLSLGPVLVQGAWTTASAGSRSPHCRVMCRLVDTHWKRRPRSRTATQAHHRISKCCWVLWSAAPEAS